MKKLIVLLLMMMGALAVHADNYTYLTFETTDGAKVSVEASSLNITISGTTLMAGGQSFALSDLSKMFFSLSDESTTIAKVANGLAFSSTTASAKMGEAFTAPTLTNPYSLSLTWTSSDESVATVGQSGAVTLVSPGTTVITATFAGSADYEAGSISYTLTVEKADPVANGLAFSSTTASAKMGEAFTAPTLTNPYSLSLTWTSSDESVATVGQSGAVTLVSPGTTVITAIFAGSDDYEAGSISYTLTVEDTETGVGSIKTNSSSYIVYNTSGLLIGKVKSLDEAKQTLRPGVYIIHRNGKTYKMSIK